MSAATVIMWVLLAQGTGGPASAVTTIGVYGSREACEHDAAQIKKTFWATTLCMERKYNIPESK